MSLIKAIKHEVKKGFSKSKFQERGFLLPSEMIEVKGHSICTVKDTLAMQSIGGVVASAVRYGFGKVVLIDDTFDELPENTREFVLLHEVCHLLNGHDEDLIERIKCIRKGEVYPNEIEADKYAADILGTDIAIESLKNIRAICVVKLGRKSLVTKEFDLRMKALKGGVQQ